MANITSFQLSLNGATYIDANSQFTTNGNPDLLPDELAVANSIYNIMNCPIGSRSRIFQPEYGSLWIQFLDEPIDQSTANKMQIASIQALARWEPRITVSASDSYILPDYSLPGYDVRISYTVNLTSQKQSVGFSLQV